MLLAGTDLCQQRTPTLILSLLSPHTQRTRLEQRSGLHTPHLEQQRHQHAQYRIPTRIIITLNYNHFCLFHRTTPACHNVRESAVAVLCLVLLGLEEGRSGVTFVGRGRHGTFFVSFPPPFLDFLWGFYVLFCSLEVGRCNFFGFP